MGENSFPHNPGKKENDFEQQNEYGQTGKKENKDTVNENDLVGIIKKLFDAEEYNFN